MIAFVLGSAACLSDDVGQALALAEPEAVVAVNAASTVMNVAHLATMHPDKAPLWLSGRAESGFGPPLGLWRPPGSVKPADGLLWRESEAWGGSSGLFGVSVARTLGATRIVLCGVPLDASAHFDGSGIFRDALRYRHAWRSRKQLLRGYCRSVSGWTRDLLGPPTAEWLGAISDERPSRVRN